MKANNNKTIGFFGLTLAILLPLIFAGCGGSSTSHGTSAQTSNHSVTLNWNASTSTVDGYKIYRGDQTGGPYSLIGSVPSASLSYADLQVTAGASYYYVATAFVSSPAAESTYSNEAAATIPSP